MPTHPPEPEQNPYTLEKTAMFASEIFIPGSSSMIVGNVGTGVVHLAAAAAVTAVLAPTMPFIATLAAIGIRLNSYQQSTTGTNLWNRLPINLAGMYRGAKEP